jgi:hypothetical protein
LGTARTGGVVLRAGNRVGLTQEEEMPTEIWTSEQRVKSEVEILKCLQELFDLCGFDEADPQSTFLVWLTLAIERTKGEYLKGDPRLDREALSSLAEELNKMLEQSRIERR